MKRDTVRIAALGDVHYGKIPILAVLGNHEYESGKHDEIRQILADTGVQVLDGEACEIHGIGFAGVKGFGGGFGERALQAWGEESIKRFVHEAVEEALKLESALARLHTPQRIVLMHYSPVQSTVEGEPREIYPFLGSSRLEEPLTHYPVPLLHHAFLAKPPFKRLELPVAAAEPQPSTPR